jgi:hypothetical protein
MFSLIGKITVLMFLIVGTVMAIDYAGRDTIIIEAELPQSWQNYLLNTYPNWVTEVFVAGDDTFIVTNRSNITLSQFNKVKKLGRTLETLYYNNRANMVRIEQLGNVSLNCYQTDTGLNLSFEPKLRQGQYYLEGVQRNACNQIEQITFKQ